jgi:uncharacterized circularly permuted ATP-grasp superfamily protein/uncharacterized alpha-E superfamily protein
MRGASALFDHTLPGQGFALAYAQQSALGHFDELRGLTPSSVSDLQHAPLTSAWESFFSAAAVHGEQALDKKQAELAQQIHKNGVTYNIHAQTGSDDALSPAPVSGPARPWSLDLFPMLMNSQEWQAIEAGVLQRAKLLEGIMADVYGPQHLLKNALLPAALTQGHRGYLRGMHGAALAGGRHLHIVAFDIARSPSNQWWLVAQRTQAPSGLGYLLENRNIIARLFETSYKNAHVRTLHATYQTLVANLRALSPGGSQAHIALLTPGPYSETYFEHAYLARELGLTLVEGADLTVRKQKLYLKTLRGLEPVHGLLKRLDDVFLDPLELRSDSALGVPGLLQCIRAGNVLVANAPGSEFLESPALLGFLPGIAQAMLGETLLMPALPTWWCGERAALEAALPRLQGSVIKPSYPMGSPQPCFDAMLGKYMDVSQRDELAGRMLRESNAYTVQGYLPLSQMPTWQSGRIALKSAMLRVYAVSDGVQNWRVLPGGLLRIAAGDQEIASMQRGGSSADVWVSEPAPANARSEPEPPKSSIRLTAGAAARLVTSRAAENLFWLGRYSERIDSGLQTAHHILIHANAAQEPMPDAAVLSWLSALAVQNSLVHPGVPSLVQSPRVFERSLLAGLGNVDTNYSIGFHLQMLRGAAFNVRSRLSQEQWDLIAQASQEFLHQSTSWQSMPDPAADVITVLTATSLKLAAITGAQTDRMTRDDGWRLLSAGRLLERLQFLSATLMAGFEYATLSFSASDSEVIHPAGFEAMLALFGSTTAYRALHGNQNDMRALLETVLLDLDNPRSIAWVVKTLRGRLAKLSGDAPQNECALSLMLPDPGIWHIETLMQLNESGAPSQLIALLQQCTCAVSQVAQAISAQYFTHSHFQASSVGT